MKNKIIIALLGICLTYSCKNKKSETAAKEPSRGIILANMDTTISPKTNFYEFVNGNWLKNTKIPEDRSSWGGFSVLRKSTDADVLKIIAKAKESNTYAPTTDQAKALFIFDSKLDTVSRDKLGIAPLQPTIDAIKNVKNIVELQTLLATNPVASAPFMSISTFANLGDSKMNAVYLGENGLGLPDRDYYLDQDSKSKEIREKYVEHISKMLQILGENVEIANASAVKILAMETTLAEPRLDKVASRDARNFNNPKTIQEAQSLIPAISLKKLMDDMGIKKQVDTLIVTQPKYIQQLNNFLEKTPLEDIKTLVIWDTFNSAAGRLTTEIETIDWEFYSKYLSGDQKQRPADERALATVNNTVGEALGQLYVDEMFPPEAKAKAETMIHNIIAAFQSRIKVLDWMSDSTKIKAIEKLDKFTVKIGYPDKWEDYSTMDVKKEDSYFDNMTAIQEWGKAKNLAKIGEPVDRTEWGMSPQTVNAYFNPLNNEIVFPAAILQPPFYDYLADDAVNYGGIGAVIGHEISHAFDDSGARFDANGNLSNWWTDEDLAKFTDRSGALADQYDQIEVLDSVHINGKFTLGENIGDLGGVLGAYDGLQQYFKENGKPDPIDGFTAEQRFFMSWATVWRTLSREDALRTQIKTDPHSPGKYRATQPLQNIDAFYEAFSIKPGDSMYLAPENRVRIW
ncbi:Endothelin-converting enzyme 1 [Cellulophaga algicola DSM 14237]|uniref:Endothelin-converting enzyme 1 n=1 Tax=Cellulophaga algicola (strain DSM 14237 / IC166 / ACAM 630) TaxID=688270 RepID=E6XA17_CELAD|nr:M13 family metallopeptidase [Cellulophaga algicola]ADV47707.1 Endothelin-converting enzyme 1 [Cellulophaga algicola DSM 14237]